MEDRESAVLEVLAGVKDAWNAGDAIAFAGLFAEDADYVTFFGLNVPGRDAIEASHRALFEGPLKGSQLVGSDEQPKVRFVRPDVAIVAVAARRSAVACLNRSAPRPSLMWWCARGTCGGSLRSRTRGVPRFHDSVE